MLEEYYSRLAALNSNPDILKGKSNDDKTKLKSLLDNVSKKIEGSEEELEHAMKEFISIFDEMGLGESIETVKTRGLSLKRSTNLPRQLINDVTIMTLKNF